MAIDFTKAAGQVRLLLNDVDPAALVFQDDEIAAFLALEPRVRLAAALAIDVNASNEVLAAKVLRSQDLTTDGAKVADALRKHAEALRARDKELTDGELDALDGCVSVATCSAVPELAEYPSPWGGWSSSDGCTCAGTCCCLVV